MFKYQSLVLLIVGLFISHSSFATSKLSIENIYLKKIVTVSKASNMQEADSDINFSITHDSKFSPSIGVGVGYYINDYVRADLILEHSYFTFNDSVGNYNYTDDDLFVTGAKSVKRKAYGRSLMLNGYVDLIKRDFFSIYVGAGVGAIKIKEKVSHSSSANVAQNDKIYTFSLIAESFTNKPIINVAHSLMVGTNIKLNPAINLEMTYAWKDFGETKHEELSSVRNGYEGHHFSLGLRFDL